MKLLAALAVVTLVVLAALQVWRMSDERRNTRTWQALAATGSGPTRVFDARMVEDLPEPARRFFQFAIREGTVLRTVAEIDMVGELSLGTREQPNYLPMRARQILAPPHGLVWSLRAGRGAMRLSGSDGQLGANSWTRFWLLYTVPVARVGGDADHARSAFGRTIAEGVFWAPATLLPGENLRWEAVDADTARAVVTHGGMSQSVDVTVAADGRPTQVVIPRWSDANPQGVYRLQPFGGTLSEFRDFDGYRLPTRVEGGNFFGTEAYFPFYRAQVERVRFVGDRKP